MHIKTVMKKVKSFVLCGGEDKNKRSLEISPPTDVRKGVLDLPGFTKDEVNQIREKASADASRLLSLTSHPPTRPSSPPYGPDSQPPSMASSRSPSATLLNSASSNLPTTLPTPPRLQHGDSDRPLHSSHGRMKGFWERTRRLSNTLSTHSHSRYQDLSGEGTDSQEGLAMLSLDLKDIKDLKDLDLDSPVSVNGGGSMKSAIEGFESQDVVGGRPAIDEVRPQKNEVHVSKRKANEAITIAKAIHGTQDGGISSDEEEGGDPAVHGELVHETKPLVTA